MNYRLWNSNSNWAAVVVVLLLGFLETASLHPRPEEGRGNQGEFQYTEANVKCIR